MCKEMLRPVILRPGLVWHSGERGVSVPIRLVNDVGCWVGREVMGGRCEVMPNSYSIRLGVLADYAIKGALG